MTVVRNGRNFRASYAYTRVWSQRTFSVLELRARGTVTGPVQLQKPKAKAPCHRPRSELAVIPPALRICPTPRHPPNGALAASGPTSEAQTSPANRQMPRPASAHSPLGLLLHVLVRDEKHVLRVRHHATLSHVLLLRLVPDVPQPIHEDGVIAHEFDFVCRARNIARYIHVSFLTSPFAPCACSLL